MSSEADQPRLALYPFRFLDPVSGRWIRARYLATRDEIAARYTQWEIIGSPEIRVARLGSFNPHRREGHLPIEEPPEREPPAEPPPEREPPVEEPGQRDPPIEEPPPEEAAQLDALERFLVRLFLRRLVTYYAWRRRFAVMEGAAVLFRGVT